MSSTISFGLQRDWVSLAFREAYEAFGAQHAEPDGVKFKEVCNRLERFLDLDIPLQEMEQKALVQILHLACAVHENAINFNDKLTHAELTVHRRASYDLTVVCDKARDDCIFERELSSDMSGLCRRAQRAFADGFSMGFTEDWTEEDIDEPATP